MADEQRPIFALGDLVRTSVYGDQEGGEGSVSVGFFHVKLFADAEVTAEQLVEAIRAAEKGEFQDVSIERLKAGPGYIELGAWLGDQGLALQFIGLGALLGQWNVITPATLGIAGEDAAQMMGMGFVMLAPTADSLLFA